MGVISFFFYFWKQNLDCRYGEGSRKIFVSISMMVVHDSKKTELVCNGSESIHMTMTLHLRMNMALL